MTKGGVAQRVVTLLFAAGAAAASCDRPPDPAAICKAELAAKTNAIGACSAAYARQASVTNARQLVAAYAADGDQALATLAALHPVDPIGAELWHRRGTRLNGREDASIHAYERALALRGGDLEGQVRELLALAQRRWLRLEMREELALRARAFEVATALADPITLAHVRVGIAIALDSVGEIAAAQRALGDSVDQLPADDQFYAAALQCAGTLQLELGHPQLATRLFERVMETDIDVAKRESYWQLIEAAFSQHDLRAVARLLETDHASGTNHAYYIARLAFERGELTAAKASIESALAGPWNSMQPTYRTFDGTILAKLGRTDDAIAQWKLAIADSEKTLGTVGLDELKQWLQRDPAFRAPYQHLFAEYAREHKALAALEVAQTATSRAYLDGLASDSSTSTENSGDVATIVRATGARVEALRVIAASLRTSPASHALPIEALVEKLAGKTVWTYFEADDDLWLVALSHGSATIDNLGPIATMRPLIDRAVALDEGALVELGSRLAPSARWAGLAPETVVHIVTDGALSRVPFAALMRDRQRWIEHTAIAYVPSASVLVALSDLRSAGDSRIVVGDPDGTLPGARAESIATATALHTRAFVGASASRSIVLGANRAEVLAVGAHADATPEGARLHLADGDITPAQIVDGRVAPELVVLASCSSAAPDLDAWGAIAGAFLAAGSANVIAARWALPDMGAVELASELYRDGAIEHPALALAVAQRHAIEHHLPVSAWAALVALGTGERNRHLLAERSDLDEHPAYVPQAGFGLEHQR